MNPLQQAISWAASAALLATLVGLFVRGRQASCCSFTVYLVAVLVPGVLIAAWPARFFTYSIWALAELSHSVLKFCIVLELGYRILRTFPGARATGAQLVLVATALAYLIILSAPAGREAPAPELLPRVLNGTIWLFFALAAIVVWYRLPVDPLHKAILVGFVPYLLIYSTGIAAIETFGSDLGARFSYVYTVAYVILAGYWARAAWQPEQRPAPLSHTGPA